VLLTGAAGRIGTAFRQFAGGRYAFRLGDRCARDPGDGGDHETVLFDIADLEACQRACAGIDTVVHLAADRFGHADFYGSLLDNNIKGAYNIFRAAKDQGCHRVVFASSVQAVSGYPPDVQVHPDDPVWPRNMYGASKCFGETVARYFAYSEELSSICVRIGLWDAGLMEERMNAHNLTTYISQRDLNHLLVCCIEAPDIQYAIVHGVSDNRYKRLDITSARELLGYAPQDDAFRLFDIDLPE
jgi:nucleoside-diphosphate-sugar epimerase